MCTQPNLSSAAALCSSLVEYGTEQPGNLSTLVTRTACFQPSYNGFSSFTVIIIRIIITTNASQMKNVSINPLSCSFK